MNICCYTEWRLPLGKTPKKTHGFSIEKMGKNMEQASNIVTWSRKLDEIRSIYSPLSDIFVHMLILPSPKMSKHLPHVFSHRNSHARTWDGLLTEILPVGIQDFRSSASVLDSAAARVRWKREKNDDNLSPGEKCEICRKSHGKPQLYNNPTSKSGKIHGKIL